MSFNRYPTLPGAGTGDVIGPGASTDNAVARWNGVDGNTLQNSSVTVDDSGNIVAAGGITAVAATFSGAVAANAGLTATTGTVNGALTVTTTTAALTVPRMTSTQRDNLTAANGMIIYNTSTDKFQGRAGGSWVDFH